MLKNKDLLILIKNYLNNDKRFYYLGKGANEGFWRTRGKDDSHGISFIDLKKNMARKGGERGGGGDFNKQFDDLLVYGITAVEIITPLTDEEVKNKKLIKKSIKMSNDLIEKKQIKNISGDLAFPEGAIFTLDEKDNSYVYREERCEVGSNYEYNNTYETRYAKEFVESNLGILFEEITKEVNEPDSMNKESILGVELNEEDLSDAPDEPKVETTVDIIKDIVYNIDSILEYLDKALDELKELTDLLKTFEK
jgi:hypothetical protein